MPSPSSKEAGSETDAEIDAETSSLLTTSVAAALSENQTSAREAPAPSPLVPQGRKKDNKSDNGTKDSNDTLLAWSFVAMTVIGLGNRIFGKLQTIPMHSYPFFSSLLSSFVYVPVCFMYIIPQELRGKISEEEHDIPKVKFAIMGGLDCLSALLR